MPRCLKTAFVALSFSILGATSLKADQISVSSFKGLNNNENALVIQDNEASDALNIDVTPGGKSIKKAAGYNLYKSLSTGRGIHGGWHFFDSGGNDIQLWGSSTSLKSITADGAPLQLISSATLDSTWDCVDTQGNAYCVDSNRDAYIKTNGATASWYTSPLGTMIEATPDRVVVAGVAGSPSTLFVSGSNSFLTYTVGPLTTDPFNEVIAAPGSKLTHIRWACQKLLWWKDASFGYFDFDDQYSASVKTISDTIGTFDNTSAIDPGGSVWFRGQDGHIWQYDCSGLVKQSIEITPLVQGSGRRTANSWTQTTTSDFSAGSGFTTYTDTTTVSGSVIPYGIDEIWNSTNAWTTLSASSFTQNGHSVISASNTTTAIVASGVTNLPNQFVLSGTVTLRNVNSDDQACLGIWKGTSAGTGYGVCLWSHSSGNTFEVDIRTNGGFYLNTVLVSSASFAYTPGPHKLGLTRSSTGYMRAYLDGQFAISATDTSNSPNFDYPIIVATNNNSITTFGSFNFRVATSTYYSAVHNAPNLIAWSSFNPTVRDTGHSFYVRASTGLFTVLSSTPIWTSQTVNALVSYATGTYMQMRDDFVMTADTQSLSLDDFAFNWYEGNAADQAYMTYFDNAIWTSVAYGVGISSNTYIFKRDLINDLWMPYSFGVGGFLVQNNHLFFGDPSTGGNVFQYGSGNSYNGSAINAYWRSKTFPGADPFLENNYTSLDTYLKRDPNWGVTANYAVNGSTSAYNYFIFTSNTSNSLIVNKKQFPLGINGHSITVQYGDSSDSSAWELFGFRILYNPYPYRPTRL